MEQVSALVEPADLHVYEDVVGAEPNLTYKSASPVPPDVTNFKPVAPAGTTMVKLLLTLTAADKFVFGTPLINTVALVVPTVTAWDLVWVAPWLSVTVKVTV